MHDNKKLAERTQKLSNAQLEQRLKTLQEARENLRQLEHALSSEIGAREFEGTWQKVGA